MNTKNMKNRLRTVGMVAGLAAMLCGGTARAAEIVKTDELTLNLGGRFKLLGELQGVVDDVRDNWRVYLFNTQDRLLLSGKYDTTKFNFEVAFGGEANNTSNNQINLLEYYAETPLLGLGDNLTMVVGQFKVPANRDSANDSGYLFFTEKSMLTQMFFNTGYDTGVGAHANFGGADLLLGTIAGAPDMPQRYLPEIFNMPPMLFARLGYDGLKEDPFHPKQWGSEAFEGSQFAAHVNGLYLQDSNAGHSTDASLGSGYFDAPSANSYFGNIVMSSKWNPYLGKTAANFGRVDATYWQASFDTQFRHAFSKETVLSLDAQYTYSSYYATNFVPFKMNGSMINTGTINIQGGQVEAAVSSGIWDIAARYVVVLPDGGLASPATNQTAVKEYNSILGFTPIHEITFPSIGWRVTKAMKITAEAIFQINAPIDTADDGTYLITEMPSQVVNSTRNTTPAGTTQYYFKRLGCVPIARMEWQLAF